MIEKIVKCGHSGCLYINSYLYFLYIIIWMECYDFFLHLSRIGAELKMVDSSIKYIYNK